MEDFITLFLLFVVLSRIIVVCGWQPLRHSEIYVRQWKPHLSVAKSSCTRFSSPHIAINAYDSHNDVLSHSSFDLKHHGLSNKLAGLMATNSSQTFQSINGLGGFTYNVESILDLTSQLLSNMGVNQEQGFSVILTTVAMKLITLPLSLPQIKASARLQRLQAIRKKISMSVRDNHLKQEEISALISTTSTKVGNPLINSLFSLLQMPITMTVQSALTNHLKNGKMNQPFLWIPNLQGPAHGKPKHERWEWIHSALRGRPTLGWKHTFAFLSLPIIQLLVNVYSHRLLDNFDGEGLSHQNESTISPQHQIVQMVTQLMPFLYMIQNISAPSALLLHWIINHMMTTIITVFARVQVEDEILPDEMQSLTRDGSKALNSKSHARRNICSVKKLNSFNLLEVL